MDSVELGPGEECIIEDTSAGQFVSQASPDANDIFGDPQSDPRVGDEYQAEIPPLLTESERLQFMKNPADTELMVDHLFAMGLPITVMWIHDQVDNVKHEQMELLGNPVISQDRVAEFGSSKQSQMKLKTEHPKLKVENSDLELGRERRSGGASPNHQHKMVGVQGAESDLDQKGSGKCYSPLPGSICNSWSDMELESFLLGLYIFGKNLVQVKSFVESKGMGDILSYYYGKFYRSDRHHRWSECQKMRSRKCIHGQRIFTGWRQQELLSRLLPHVSEDCQITLVEVSKTFADGKISLEEYVSFLKATVGMKTLIEAIGIGKGKRDLTGTTDPIKSNQAPIRQEIPTGKACNSLSSGDIINFLTGGFRLSKAKSSDLFWEAVWPRLLARGWHSEQPKNHIYTGSKNSLVFLVPGVKKFSRRRHVKGNHYFDSVADVLNKVASEPELIEVESEVPRGCGSNEENGWSTKGKLDKDGSSDHQRHCYLQPRSSNCNVDVMKFTVIDTSFYQEDGPFKIRELRTLPVDTTIDSNLTSSSRETGRGSSEEPEDEPESSDHVDSGTSRPVRDMFHKGACTGLSDCLVSVPKKRKSSNGLDTTNIPVGNHEEQYADMCNDKHPRKTVKRQFSRRAKAGQSNYLAPTTKRRRLTACGRVEKRLHTDVFSAGSKLNQKDNCYRLVSAGASENMVSEVGPSGHKVYTSSSSKDSPDEGIEGILSENRVHKAKPRTLIDLNLPHVEEDFESAEPFSGEVAECYGDPNGKESSSLVETSPLENSQTPKSNRAMITEEHQPAENTLRQSKRTRPPTTKALEALACGFLSTKRKQRKSREDTIPRPSRGVRGRVGATTSINAVSTGLVVPKVDEGIDEASSSNTKTNMVSYPQVQSERKVALELLGIPYPDYHHLAEKDN